LKLQGKVPLGARSLVRLWPLTAVGSRDAPSLLTYDTFAGRAKSVNRATRARRAGRELQLRAPARLRFCHRLDL